MNDKLKTTAILAMTADGKIADYKKSAARFGSQNDKRHLEQQVSLVDGVIFGANTLRAYGTTLSVSDPQLIEARKNRCQSPQPVQIVVSTSGNLNTAWQFFQQPIPRWLLTIPTTARKWQDRWVFERILTTPMLTPTATSPNDFSASDRLAASNTKQSGSSVDWLSAFGQLSELGLTKLAILGGGELIASLIELNLIDELWLTVCPLILGGYNAPTPVGGRGFIQSAGKKLKLLEIKQIESEIFLHYQILIGR